jgi:hypothetical protein
MITLVLLIQPEYYHLTQQAYQQLEDPQKFQLIEFPQNVWLYSGKNLF